jgi:hypothetical protein
MLVTEAFVEIAEATFKSRGVKDIDLIVLARDTDLQPAPVLRQIILDVLAARVLPQVREIAAAPMVAQ